MSILLDLRKQVNMIVRFKGYECNNAYAYAAADLVDMLGLLRNLGRPPISPQEITDCSSDKQLMQQYSNEGCYNGLLNNSLYYIQKYGVFESDTYPTSSGSLRRGENQTCKTMPSNGKYSRKYRIYNWI